jgi:hypothetical protein
MRTMAVSVLLAVSLACARDPLGGRTHIKWQQDLGLLTCVKEIGNDLHTFDPADKERYKPVLDTIPAKL